MRLPICGMLLFAALTAAAPAFGQNADWNQCADVNNRDAVARSLAACNRILKDNREAKNHPMALRNRWRLARVVAPKQPEDWIAVP